MGLFWDLLQQSQIHSNSQETQNLESRVQALGSQVHHLQETLLTLLARLEKHVGQDLNGDGLVAGQVQDPGPSGRTQ